MYRTITSILVVCLFVIFAVGSGPKDIQPNFIKYITLVEYKPSSLEVSGNPIELRKVGSRKFLHNGSYELEDNNLVFTISLTKSSIGNNSGKPTIFNFEIFNKTAEPARIKWNEISYIDENGIAQNVTKSGVRLVDRAQPLGDTLIPPNSKIDESLFPIDDIYYVKGKYGGWRSNPGIEKLGFGQKISIFMPIEINGKSTNYSFGFEVKGQIIPN